MNMVVIEMEKVSIDLSDKAVKFLLEKSKETKIPYVSLIKNQLEEVKENEKSIRQ